MSLLLHCQFYQYFNIDATFIWHRDFNLNHNDNYDEKITLIQCHLAIWDGH